MNNRSTWQWYAAEVSRTLTLVVLGAAVATFIVFIVVQSWRPAYQTHFSYLVSLTEREPVAQEFRFDGYYALQATDLFTATLARWIGAPETIVAAYAQANVSLPADDPGQIGRTVRAEKTAPQLIQVSVTAPSQAQAEQLASSLQHVVAQRIEQYHEQGIPALHFAAVAGGTWTSHQEPAVGFITTATALAALFLGINIVLLRASLQRLDSDHEHRD